MDDGVVVAERRLLILRLAVWLLDDDLIPRPAVGVPERFEECDAVALRPIRGLALDARHLLLVELVFDARLLRLGTFERALILILGLGLKARALLGDDLDAVVHRRRHHVVDDAHHAARLWRHVPDAVAAATDPLVVVGEVANLLRAVENRLHRGLVPTP
jgi:hypothetical protein